MVGSCRNCGRCGGIGCNGRDHAELHYLARRSRIGDGEVSPRDAAAKGLVWAHVAKHVVARWHVGEIDDHIGALSEAHEQAVAVGRREVHGGSQEATFIADLPHFYVRDAAEVQDQEAGLAAVQEAEAVAALLHGLERPVFPLTMIMLPKNSGFQIGEMSVSGI